MKTLVTTGSFALLLALVACGPSTPPVKPVEKNTQAPAPGSVTSPSEELKKHMSSADSSTAGSAANQGAKKSK